MPNRSFFARLAAAASQLIFLAPLFLGPCLAVLPRTKTFLAPYVSRYFYFLLLVAAWEILLSFVAAFGPGYGSSQQTKYQRAWAAARILSAVVLIVLALGALEIWRSSVNAYGMYLALGIITSRALALRLEAKNQLGWASLTRALYRGLLAYTTFYLTSEAIYWQPILAALALACMFAAYDLSRFMLAREDAGSLKPTLYSRCAKLYALLLMLGPTLLAVLCVRGELEHQFLFAFGALPLSIKAIESLPRKEPEYKVPTNFARKTKLIVWVYVVIIAVISLIVARPA